MFRFEEQLQRWLEVDPLDSISIPLFVPSTLLSMPGILVPKQRQSTSAPCVTQVLNLVPLLHYFISASSLFYS